MTENRERDFTAKEALSDLFGIAEQLPPIKDKEPKYAPLIDYIFNRKPGKLPTLKTVGAKTGLKPHILGKQIKELYSHVLNQKGFLKFEEGHFELHFRYNKRYYGLYLENIPVVPWDGEVVEFSFISSHIGISGFYVK